MMSERLARRELSRPVSDVGMNDELRALGWDDDFQRAFEALDDDHAEPARVIEVQRGLYRIAADIGVTLAEFAGPLRRARAAPPVVGDWVSIDRTASGERPVIQRVLDRRSQLTRKAPGKPLQSQILAANLDCVFLVTSCNEDLSPRRIERYLTMIWDGGVKPVVLLNKADLVDDPQAAVSATEPATASVPVHAVSALAPGGLDPIRSYLVPGTTIALLGSSGVGKSTIVNALMGHEVQTVRAIRADDAKGRHTTTSRHLFRLPSGALLIDTPGLREVGLWRSESGLTQTFPDIDELARKCRFHDCAHGTEPGCAVQAAIGAGTLSRGRFDSYEQLSKELEHLERRMDPEQDSNQKKRWKAIHRNVRDARKRGWLPGRQ